MEKTQTNTWYTGDWNPYGNNPDVPYNGIKIVATANYARQTNSQISGDLVSIDLQIVDYTNDPNGISSDFQLTKSAMWYDIPIPTKNFTVTGVNGTGLGLVKLDVMSSGIFLNIQFSYGIVNRKREEMGYIMRFASQEADIE